MRKSLLLSVAALALGAAVGFSLGRRSASTFERPSREAAALRQRLALAEERLREQSERTVGLLENHVDTSARAAGHTSAGEADEGEEAFPIDRKLVRIQELIAAIEGMLGDKDLYRQDVLDFVEDRLLKELAQNPAALAWALDKFRDSAGTPVGALLSVALGQLKDPSVESLALELARSDTSPARQLAGLDLLDRLDIENPETRGAVLAIIRGETRPEVLAAALFALHRGVPDPRETRDTTATLTALVSNPDAEVRRRAVIALGEWAPDVASLNPVVRALGDSSVDVRAGAAFTLGQSRLSSPAMIDALAARVADTREDWAVREQAWRAMGHFPLDDRAHAVYAKFREEHDAAGESSPAGDSHDH